MMPVTGGLGMIGAHTAGAPDAPADDPYLGISRLIADTGFARHAGRGQVMGQVTPG